MAVYTQDNRLLSLTTPLGPDVLLPVSLTGHEEISRLFSFQLELLAPVGQPVPFDGILGQSATATLRQGRDATRHFNGIVSRFSQTGRDTAFTSYRAVLAPRLWLLTLTRRCRIFQELSTPDILRRVLHGLDVRYHLLDRYEKRNYCVQYQESDFDFVSRLMEEDGIHYYFTHGEDQHQLVISDATRTSPRLPAERSIVFGTAEGAATGDWQVSAWEKSQELRAGRAAVRDHCFEMPGNPLQATQASLDSVTVGTVSHRLLLSANEQQEIYRYPGRYAKQHDQVAPDGGTQAADLGGMFAHRDRAVRLRMEAEECAAVRVDGRSNCGMFAAGAKFDITTSGDAAGTYLLVRVEHMIRNAGWRTEEKIEASYANRFSCVAAEPPYRPACTTARPRIEGFQTAVVVGPKGEELFCDRYGRIKVQFHWDRDGQHDGRSSCWLRVAQVWAGNGWGAFFWPRIGHEVVVLFEDGDPDCPMVAGSVYNAANLPPYAMPTHKLWGGIRSASDRSSARQHFNSIVFNDQKGTEHLAIHSERNLSLNSENDKMTHAGRHKGERVANSSMLAVGSMPGSG